MIFAVLLFGRCSPELLSPIKKHFSCLLPCRQLYSDVHKKLLVWTVSFVQILHGNPCHSVHLNHSQNWSFSSPILTAAISFLIFIPFYTNFCNARTSWVAHMRQFPGQLQVPSLVSQNSTEAGKSGWGWHLWHAPIFTKEYIIFIHHSKERKSTWT